jgi:hypothetical protein
MIHVAARLATVGLTWFVQIVRYALFDRSVWVVSKVVPTHPALVSNRQRGIVKISAHQRW